MKKNAVLLMAMFGATALSGCSATKVMKQPEQSEVMAKTEELSKQIAVKGESHKFVREHEGAWILGNYVASKEMIDDRLKEEVVFSSTNFVLPYLASRLTELTPLTYKLSDDLYETGSDWKTYGGTTQATTSTSAPVDTASAYGGSKDSSGTVTIGQPLGLESVISTTTTSASQPTVSGVKNPFTDEIKVIHKGSIHSLLDKVAAAYGISWRFDALNGVVWFYRTETKMFTLKFPGESLYETKSDSSQGSEISKINAEMSLESEKWEDVVESVKPMLTRFGNIRLVKSANQLVVTDTPSTLKKIREYIDHVNDIYTRRVEFYVQILSVQMENNENYGGNFSNFLQSFTNGNESLSISGGMPSSGVAGSVIATGTSYGGRLTGDIVLEALSKRYETSVVKSFKASGTYGQPIMMKSVRDTVYISGQSYDAVSNAGSSLSIETETKPSGLSMVIVPRIESERDISVDVSMELSNLIQLRTYQGSLVESPVIDRKTISNRTVVRNNQTMILTAFETEEDTDTRSGVGNENFWLLGGGKADAAKRERLLVLITPVLSNQ
jgi:type IVB pilus formation R64 PilN family outer membrane protein